MTEFLPSWKISRSERCWAVAGSAGCEEQSRLLCSPPFLHCHSVESTFPWVVNNLELGFQKDSAYEFLKNPRYNWRKFLLGLVTVVVRFMDVLTSEQREKVLIIDDSTYVVAFLAATLINRNASIDHFRYASNFC